MPSDLELTFTKRVNHFFRLRRIHLDSDSAKPLMKFLYDQFESQGRFKAPEAPFFLTPRFMINAVSNYLKVSHAHGIALFRDIRAKRSSARYSPIDLDDVSGKQPGKGLIHLLGRKHKPVYKLTKKDGEPVTPTRVAKTQFSSFNLGYSPLEPLILQEKARHRARAADDSVFERDMVINDDMALWRKVSPQKTELSSPYRV